MNLKLFEEKKVEKQKNPVHQIVNYFFELKGWADQDKEFYIENKIYYGQHVKRAKELLETCDGNLEKAKKCLDILNEWSGGGFEWEISTCFKRPETLSFLGLIVAK